MFQAHLWHDLNGHHHAFVFVLDDVAVEHEPPDNFGVRERNQESDLAGLAVPRGGGTL